MDIHAKIIKDSISINDKRITTFEIQLPKVLLAEFNTHRSVSRNFQSSRAIPTAKANEIESFFPAYWGLNQPGMMAKREEIYDIVGATNAWQTAIDVCKTQSTRLADLGLHKQWSNRLNDWHVMARGVITATDWENLLWLRDDEEAQPEFEILAKDMKRGLEESTPFKLFSGEWHVPYVNTRRDDEGWIVYSDAAGDALDIGDAQKISASCCAQVSYRRLNDSREKALEIYGKLFSGRKPHLSPTEHQATPVRNRDFRHQINPSFWDQGVTHVTRDGMMCSGNFSDWVQYRQTLPDNVFK